MEKKFCALAMTQTNPDWDVATDRLTPLYTRDNDARSPFFRDYTRIIHSSGFRRLKHKTQVFFSPQSDHICTRIEHVLHVESIASAISDSLGLNSELVRTIAVGHDLGHSPFGHKGERVLNDISKNVLGEPFWHEKNSLYFVDKIELLEDDRRQRQNLNLTYAVRDGLICHCGEATENHLYPRRDAIDLETIAEAGRVNPFTYEGCVVKMADRISYIGRDIEDALALGVLSSENMEELEDLVCEYAGDKINNTIIINYLINDLCLSSDPGSGICFSPRTNEFIKLLGDFNLRYIYRAPRVARAEKFFEIVIREIFRLLFDCFDSLDTLERLDELRGIYPKVTNSFMEWLRSYWTLIRDPIHQNPAIFDITDEKDYAKAVISYIAGMSDRYAMECFNEIISF
ncbi:MAG: HD domain-containing protein [Clostridia bacterium]|nr:HD domain-containing protein [Clostridia bacterium]